MFKNKKGFTLVELLAVIVILAIILAIAVPSITGMIDNAKKGAFESDVKMIITGINYRLLQGTINTSATLPQVGDSNVADLANYGADPTQYSSFSITDLDPITISLQSTTGGKFGGYGTTGATKATVTATLP